MSLDRKFSDDGKELTIHLGQKFDFEKVRDFRLAYSEGIEEVNSIIINLQNMFSFISFQSFLTLALKQKFSINNIQ